MGLGELCIVRSMHLLREFMICWNISWVAYHSLVIMLLVQRSLVTACIFRLLSLESTICSHWMFSRGMGYVILWLVV